jgi:hypothetical protein
VRHYVLLDPDRPVAKSVNHWRVSAPPRDNAGAQRTAAEFNVGTQEARWHNLSAARHLVWLKLTLEMMPERTFVRNALSARESTPDEDKGAHARSLPFELCLARV